MVVCYRLAPAHDAFAAAAGQGATVAIHDVQGSGPVSPLVGQIVSTSGIVTAIKGNGFFIQAPDASADGDPNPSEAVFVFTSTSPPSATVARGNSVMVSGTVAEFKPSSDPDSPPLTEISGSPQVAVVSTGNPVPSPVTLTPADTNPSGTIEQLERFEGMRVHVDSLTAVSPTSGTVNERRATSTSDGVFYAVITGVARPFREPGVELPDPLPPGSPCCVPRFDANPERLRIDSDGQAGASAIEVTSGATITNVTGPLDYSSRAYTILLDPESPPVVSGLMTATPAPARAADEFTIASFNMQRFFDRTDDPGTSDVALTQEAFDRRLRKASLVIRRVLGAPDIIAVEEVENLATLQAIADRIEIDSVFDDGPASFYRPFLVEGNDPSGIDVGLLIKFGRVSVLSVEQQGKTATYTNPNTGLPETLNDRPPLVLQAVLDEPGFFPFQFTLIANHLRSLSGINDPADGARVRAKRRAQAEFLANLIQSRQAASPDERIISVGDYNAFEFNDGYVDSIGTIRGTPAPPNEVVLASNDLVNPDLTDLIEMAPADQRYSFIFDGNAQALDHVLVTQNLLGRVNRIHYARTNADFPESYRNDATRPERISDHDIPVAYISIASPPSPLSVTKTASAASVVSGSQITYTITVSNTGPGATPNVLVTDILATGTTLVSVNASQGTCTPSFGGVGPARCQLGMMGPGSSATMTVIVTATINPQFPMTVTNTVTATAVIDGKIEQAIAAAQVTVTPAPPVITGASVSGKKLFVTGSNFNLGAVVEINGNAQKTANDEQNPTTVLIAKKGGKKIDRGETATLTVLNPFGLRSAPFAFTRPAQ